MENLCELLKDWKNYTRGVLYENGDTCLIGECLLKKGVPFHKINGIAFGYNLAKDYLGLNYKKNRSFRSLE